MAFTVPRRVTSGTYTPTLTNTTNVAASTAFVARYIRVGSQVTVYGTANIDPTLAAPTTTVMKISLPIASDFTGSAQCAGVAIDGPSSQVGAISADATDNVASLTYPATSTAEATWRYTFGYTVL